MDARSIPFANNQKLGLTRRSMFAGAGAVAGAAAFAGALLTSNPQARASEIPSEWDDEADVIVVGAGTAMMAAIKAAEAGAKVIVCEKNASMGGDVLVNGGIIYATETSVMADAGGVIDPRTGKNDTKESMVEDWLRRANGPADEGLVRHIVDGGPALIDWFRDRGLNFGLYQSGGDPVTRGHQVTESTDGSSNPTLGSGYNFVNVMSDEFDKLGITAYTGTRVIEVLRDIADRPVGVKARDTDGNIKLFGGKAVILATGGAGENTDLTMQYNPEAMGWLNDGRPGQLGDGYYLAEPFGAARVGQGNWFDPINPNYGLSNVVGGTLMMEIATVYFNELIESGPSAFIWTDYEGKRFTNEVKGYVNGSALDVAQTDTGHAWAVFDDSMWDKDMFAGYFEGRDREELIESGIILKADTLDDLAALITGMDAGVLASTVARWNEMSAAGEDADYGRVAQNMQAIERAPFYAYEVVPSSDGRCIGPRISLDIDADYRLLDRAGQPIPGMYACGHALTWYRQVGWGSQGSGTACGCMAGTGHCGECAAAYALGLDEGAWESWLA